MDSSMLSFLFLSPLLSTTALGQVVIDFSDLQSNGDKQVWQGDRYMDLGVLFSTADEAAPLRSIVARGNTCIYATTDVASDTAIITDFLSGPSSYVGFSVIDILNFPAAENWLAEIYDAQGNLLDTMSSNIDSSDGSAYFEFQRASADVSRFVFTPSSDSEALDNFTFNIVPTTSSLGTMLLAGVLAFRRRR